jgi:predicted amidohydrolase
MRIAPFILIASSLAGQTAPVKLKVAAVQFRSSYDIADNAKRMVDVLNRLSREGVQVAAFPECALTGYQKDAVMAVTPAQITAAEAELAAACRERKIAAMAGGVYKVNGKTYNTAAVFDSQGRLVERYAKLMLAGEKWATPGNHIAFFELEGVPSTVIICHDERYPEFVRLPAMQGARVVYYISSESGMREESSWLPTARK